MPHGFPSVPYPINTIESHYEALLALKEAVEMLTGQRSESLYSVDILDTKIDGLKARIFILENEEPVAGGGGGGVGAHTHPISDVTSLQGALDSKQASGSYAASIHSHLWADITDKPTTFTPSAHTHDWVDITTGKPTTLAGYGITDAAASGHTHAYSSLTSIPATFAPSAHTHLWADLTDKPTTFDPSAHTHAYGSLTSIPATFAPSAHNHSWTEITSGKPTTLAGYGITDAAPSSHVGAGGTAHADVVAAGAAGFITGADKTKLDGVSTSANNYTHPTGDGNLHVPATSNTNNTRVLKAGATAGSGAWGQVAYSELSSIPATFAPSAHTHLWADTTDKPTTFAPSTHNHDWADITSGKPTTLAGYGITDGADSLTIFRGISADVVGANISTGQAPFGTLTAITLEVGLYEVKMELFATKSAGTTSHTIAFNLAGTATRTGAVKYRSSIAATNILAVLNEITTPTAGAAVVVTAAIAAASQQVRISIRGLLRITATGTIVPTWGQSTAAGGAYTWLANSHILFRRLSDTTTTTTIN